jgi:hypothetical protein
LKGDEDEDEDEAHGHIGHHSVDHEDNDDDVLAHGDVPGALVVAVECVAWRRRQNARGPVGVRPRSASEFGEDGLGGGRRRRGMLHR